MDSSPEFRVQQIKGRRLEIAATLAEWKRAFIVEGVERPFADRVTLEAEDAALALEINSIKYAAVQAKADRRARLNNELLATLLRILNERGLGDLVAEAEQQSAEALGSEAAA